MLLAVSFSSHFYGDYGRDAHAYVNRARLERAAIMLQREPGLSITDIAFETGFSSSAASSRFFKQHFGCSASVWKKQQAQRVIGLNEVPHNTGKDSRFRNGQNAHSHHELLLQNLTMKRMPAFHVAYVASQEGYHFKEVQAAWDRLCKWAAARNLLTPDAAMLGISYDDPDITPFNKCRYYACMSVPDHIPGLFNSPWSPPSGVAST